MNAIAGFLIFFTLVHVAPQADAGRMTGRITAESTNAPIAGVRVMLFPARMPSSGPFGPPPQAVTDQDGRFGFDHLAPGAYRIDAQKTGYAPLLERAPLQVAAGESIAVDLRLQKGAAITGRVLAPSGEPMTDAHVMAMRLMPALPRAAPSSMVRLIPAPGNQGGQQTNDLGEFRVSGLAPGEYYIAAMSRPTSPFGGPAVDLTHSSTAKTTIATTFYPGTIDQGSALPIAVTAGAEVGNIVFTMQSVPAYRITGIVVNQDGQPVAGAMVSMIGDPRNGGAFMGPAGGAHSGADGQFAIGDVPAGTYRLMASIPMAMGGAGAAGFASFSSAGGAATSSSSSGIGGADMRPAEIVVADADVAGVRVVVRKQR